MTRPLVVDASAVVTVLVRTGPTAEVEQHLATHEAFAPEVLDLEVLSALARLERGEVIAGGHARDAAALLGGLPIRRVRHAHLAARAFSLRANLSVYDASYVALAEALEAHLLTLDGRLARAPRLPIDVLHLRPRAGGGAAEPRRGAG